MYDKMTDDLRSKLQEFINENPDAVAPTPIAKMEGFEVCETMIRRFEGVIQSMPLDLLFNPITIAGLTGHLHAIAEFELLLERGQVASADPEEVMRRTKQRVDTIIIPYIERMSRHDDN